MLKKLLTILALFLLPLVASATILGVQQGGTASGTLTGILIGNGISSVNTLTIGSNLTLSGTTLSATGGGGSSTFSTTSLSAVAPLQYSQSPLAQFSITQSGTGGNGYLSSTDFNTFNNKISSTSLTVTTSGTSGASTYTPSTGVFNIPQYQAGGNYITALTGDGTASGPGSAAFTLATVNASPGTFTYSTVTVNAKGLVTSVTNGTAPTTYTGTFPIQVTGSVISSLFSTTTNSGVAPGNVYVGSGGILQTSASSTFFGALGTPGQVLMSSNGSVVWAATSTAASSLFAYPFTPGVINFGTSTNATSTPISFFSGLFASSTSAIASTTFAINGNVGIGTSSPVATLTLASKTSADQTPALVIDGANGSFNADLQLNRGSNTGTEEANIDFATAGIVNYQLGIQNNSTSDFELWDGSNDPVFTVKSGTNNIGFGTSTPFGDFAINADFGDVLPGNLIFNVASSSLTATTSLFSVSNIGSTTIGLFGACSGTSALTTGANGTIVCGAISGTGGAAYPFTPTVYGTITLSATSTALLAPGGVFGTSTIGTLVASSSITNQSVKSALVLNGATGLEGAYGGAAGCSNQVVTAISAVGATTCSTLQGVMFGTVSANTVFGNFTGAAGTPAFFATSSLFTIGTGLTQTSNTLGLTIPVVESSGGTGATSIANNMLIANNAVGVVIATSTPSATAYFATSTTATSTFAGAFLVGTTTENSTGLIPVDFMQVISNTITTPFGGLLINTPTNVSTALTVKNATGCSVLNVDTTATLSAYQIGTTSPSGCAGTFSTPQAELSIVSLFGQVPYNRTLFLIASSSQLATSTLFSVNNVGHVIASSTNPVVTCTSGTLTSFTGDDTHGEGVCGTASTAMIVTFGAPWSNAPICIISNQGMSITSALTYTITTTALTISQAVGLATDKIDFMCEGTKGPQ